ncbi:murein transglycosylase domain-containing protein [Litoribrevibacter albus]|uniref:Membrane-bound lytic murein transglycosylase C n=1 Tax=Litoribrevibacter albus TaxID=1473156 RepID=A0AA37W5P4_9GAMM|nr:murein transglycosylase domain-containing protein [Litoribrevibacter albus]GLQ30730.1 membrane-bound lytic murein transglycosylase C [Litoribrevibacter albus]
MVSVLLKSIAPAAILGLAISANMSYATDEFEQFKQQHLGEAAQYQQTQEDEFKAYVKAYRDAFNEYKKELAAVWGDDVVISDKTNWVTHSDDLTTRNEVDFKNDEIRITLVVEDDLPEDQIKTRITEELTKIADTSVDQANRNDPISQKVDEIIATKVIAPTLPPEFKPDLKPVITITDQPVSSTGGKKQIEQLVQTAKVDIKPAPKPVNKSAPPVKKSPSNKHRIVVTVPMPKVAISSKAERFKQPVTNSSTKWKIDDALILAVIHTESSFNPMARSHIPAYGLMQIVPRSAGQDASALIYGNSRMLTSSYLYTPDKNINVGAAYLHILNSRYLSKIENPESRLYCIIAAYNTGAGNVARAFTGKTSVTKAAPKINSMTPFQVYNHLLRNLPHDETKDYLKRVSSRYEAYKKGVL